MHSPVPQFIHSLKALSRILAKAEAHCAARKINPAVLFSDRLYPDMLPLSMQVSLACDHAKGAAARLAGIDVPRHEDDQKDFSDLQARIDRTIEFLDSIPADAFRGAEQRHIHVKAGPRELDFPALQYFYGYALPNFYFHMTTAYNILRHNGVEIGKADFLGG